MAIIFFNNVPATLSKVAPPALVLGYVDATVVWKVNVGGIPVCIPEEPRLTIQQIADVIVKWFTTHLKEKDQAAGYLVKVILEETWRCRES